jgi:hypothetical protein
LGKSGDGVEGKQGGDGGERAQPRTEFGSEYFFHVVVCIFSFQRFIRRVTRTFLSPLREANLQTLQKMKCRPW